MNIELHYTDGSARTIRLNGFPKTVAIHGLTPHPATRVSDITQQDLQDAEMELRFCDPSPISDAQISSIVSYATECRAKIGWCQVCGFVSPVQVAERFWCRDCEDSEVTFLDDFTMLLWEALSIAAKKEEACKAKRQEAADAVPRAVALRAADLFGVMRLHRAFERDEPQESSELLAERMATEDICQEDTPSDWYPDAKAALARAEAEHAATLDAKEAKG